MTYPKIIQILKIRAYFMQNFMELNMKKFFNPKTVTLRMWGLEASFQQFGSKRFDLILSSIIS